MPDHCSKRFLKKEKKVLTIRDFSCRISNCDEPLAQQAEHLTFNQGVRRSNRRWLTISGALEKRLNSPAFHAGIHGFESHTRHHQNLFCFRTKEVFSFHHPHIHPNSTKSVFAFRAVFISEISFFLSDFDLRQTAFGGFTISSGDITTGISHGDDHIIQRDLSRIAEKTG